MQVREGRGWQDDIQAGSAVQWRDTSCEDLQARRAHLLP